MLERAAACIKSGVRGSRRCAQTTARSGRLLHANFFTSISQGSGDFELPPWAIGMSPIPADLPLKSDRHVWMRPLQDRHDSKQHACGDGVFLDFLYPPQALAWVRKASGQQWERWERRNARRLPEGFVQASRGYASRSYVHAVTAPAQDITKDVDEDNSPVATGQKLSDDGRDGTSTGDTAQAPRHDLRSRPAKTNSQHIDWSHEEPRVPFDRTLDAHRDSHPGSISAAFVDSPADLAEALADALAQIRSVTSANPEHLKFSSSEQADEHANHVWGLYQDLDDRAKDNTVLKESLIHWLSVHPASAAQARCIELYSSVPLRHRTLSMYMAAMSVILRNSNDDEAIKLHAEAVEMLPNGDRITKVLLEHALDSNKFDLVVLIEQHLRAACSSSGQDRPLAMFWLHVSEVPQLFHKALQLLRYRTAPERAKSLDAETRQFCSKFYREALNQEFQPTSLHDRSFAKKLPERSIRALIRHVSSTDEDAVGFLEQLLGDLIQSDARYDYGLVHNTVSYVYLRVQMIGGANWKLHPNSLMKILEHLTSFYDTLQKQPDENHCLTIGRIVRDWRHQHHGLSVEAVRLLMSFAARRGQARRVRQWQRYLAIIEPSFEKQKRALLSTLYVHARRADVGMTRKAFEKMEKMAATSNSKLDLLPYNVLLHAHSRADDLEGAIMTFQRLLERGLTPNSMSFHPVTELLAKRGDVAGVKDLLRQYDELTGGTRWTALIGSLIQAHVKSGQMDEAVELLRSTVEDVRARRARGPLTGCFNIVLTAHAIRRSIDFTMGTYRWMKAEGVPMDANTYASLIRVLTSYRQTPAAHRVITHVMKEQNIQPTAFHYALVMGGYMNQGMLKKALKTYKEMKARNLRDTASTNAVYLKVKAMLEMSKHIKNSPSQPVPLRFTLRSMNSILRAAQGQEITAKQPQLSVHGSQLHLASFAQHFDYLIFAHGKQNCMEAVRQLYERYHSEFAEQQDHAGDIPVIQILTAMMAAHLRAKDYTEVESYWKLAVKKADHAAASVSLPNLLHQPNSETTEVDPYTRQLGANVTSETNNNNSELVQQTGSGNDEALATAWQVLLHGKDVDSAAERISPGRTFILARALRLYIYALAAQDRVRDIAATVTSIVRQGYTLDKRAWNVVIRSLCETSPPLTLLAFALTERFLISDWPGWGHASRFYSPLKSARKEGLEYIRARYLRPDQLMPEYRTLVHLGAALLKLQKIELAGRKGLGDRDRYVGSARAIGQQARRVLAVVRGMPTVDDDLQRRLLGAN